MRHMRQCGINIKKTADLPLQGKTILPPQHKASVTLRNVARKIIAVVNQGHGGGEQVHLKDLEWEIVVVKSPEVNAFVVPGGKIVVYTGACSCLLLNLLGAQIGDAVRATAGAQLV